MGYWSSLTIEVRGDQKICDLQEFMRHVFEYPSDMECAEGGFAVHFRAFPWERRPYWSCVLKLRTEGANHYDDLAWFNSCLDDWADTGVFHASFRADWDGDDECLCVEVDLENGERRVRKVEGC